MLKTAIALTMISISFIGCSSKAPTPSDQNISKPINTSPLTIFAPHKFNMDSNTFVYYDYFLDCQEDKCKVGKMKYGQYITIDVPYGFHSIFIKTSSDGFMNTLLVMGRNDVIEQHINIQPDKKHFISHSWSQSFGRHVIGLLAAPPSFSQDLPEEYGKAELDDLLRQHETFSGRLHNYGVKGITY